MLEQPVDTSTMQNEGGPRNQGTFYGHPNRYATKCAHHLHPSTPQHTPLCPACISSRAKSSMNLALKGLVAEGGLVPPDYFRDRRWNQAKLRNTAQLREEREQTWEESHQRYYSQRVQTGAPFQHPAECPVCASSIARFPTKVSEVAITKDIAWWERASTTADDYIAKPRQPYNAVRPARLDRNSLEGSSVLRPMIRQFRNVKAASEAQRKARETKYRTESAVRRKHSLDGGYHFDADFWDAPISAHLSRQAYQCALENQRMAERRARGNVPRPRPPRSSLSYSEHTDDLDIDKRILEDMSSKEEMEMLEREARKIGEEVGYLYFVGEIDGLHDWREDFLRSDRQLVFRSRFTGSGGTQSNSGEDNDEVNEAEKEDETDEDDGSYDEVDMSG
ncbi:hypothetical protein EK21DRAFT_101548 [Setomelanomma holmii]|uniref:Uncharacterized protein n=1 Tax=Setomelanomma holmii TaxID=210430 RepID=A0A9P4LJ50_9PLEO|nr:hypothetical protein EK21DRAFT_101548 [Setomelanomma holmii]